MTKIIINEITGVKLSIDGLTNTAIVKGLQGLGASIGRTSVSELVAGKREIASGFKIMEMTQPQVIQGYTKRRGRKPLNGTAMTQKEINTRAYAKRKMMTGISDTRGRPQLNQIITLKTPTESPRFNGGETNKMFTFYGMIQNGTVDYNSLTTKMQESYSGWKRQDTVNGVTYLSNRGLVIRENQAKYNKKS